MKNAAVKALYVAQFSHLDATDVDVEFLYAQADENFYKVVVSFEDRSQTYEFRCVSSFEGEQPYGL